MKRRLLTILIFLLAGSVVNVTVAWGCVTRSLTCSPDPRYVGRPAPEERVHFASLGWTPANYKDGLELVFWEMREAGQGLTEETFYEAVRFTSTGKLALGGQTGRRIQAGWPLLALTGEQFKREPGFPAVWQFRASLPLPMLQSVRPYPLQPCSPGFALNTFLYATILWSLIRGPFAVRRFLRVRQGLCPQCAYPMGESAVCSECGQALPQRMRARHVRRRLLTVLVFLFAGAVVNVGVAWTFAMRTTLQVGGPFWFDDSTLPCWQVAPVRWHGIARVMYSAVPEGTEWFDPRGVGPDCVPYWCRASRRRPSAEDLEKSLRIEDASGWPMLAMSCEIDTSYPIEYLRGETVEPEVPLYAIFAIGVAGGIPIKNVYPDRTPPGRAPSGATYNDGFWDVRVLPVRPIWRGFAINTLFYATLLWLLICGPFALRRLLRVRRGLCPKCAYRMGESGVCSECGRELPVRARVPT